MKWFGENSLSALFGVIKGKDATFSSAVSETFDEVYENMEDLDSRILDVSYDADTETLSFLCGTAENDE